MQDGVGRTAVVTGGASGIGFAMARSFATAGMKVAIADVETHALERAAEALREITPELLALPVDVTDRDRLARAAIGRCAPSSESTYLRVMIGSWRRSTAGSSTARVSRADPRTRRDS
jgi:NAD(P)-dependent dehydrogenase (short-subunit alcohol dehydrogenase family)